MANGLELKTYAKYYMLRALTMGKGNWVAMAAAAAAVVILAVAGRVEGRRGYGEEVKAVHVAGEVLCQDCNQGWAEWIDGKPIKGTYDSLLPK